MVVNKNASNSAPSFKELNNLFTRNLLSKPNFDVIAFFFFFFCKRERGSARSAGTSFITQDFWLSGISDLGSQLQVAEPFISQLTVATITISQLKIT